MKVQPCPPTPSADNTSSGHSSPARNGQPIPPRPRISCGVSPTHYRPAHINIVKWARVRPQEAFLIPIIVGILLAVGIAALAKVTRFDEDRSFYSTILIIIASFYMLFAVLGDSGHALVWELGIAVAFSTVAIVGALFFTALVWTGSLPMAFLIWYMMRSLRIPASRPGGQSSVGASMCCLGYG
jgi:hypothetical protein